MIDKHEQLDPMLAQEGSVLKGFCWAVAIQAAVALLIWWGIVYAAGEDLTR